MTLGTAELLNAMAVLIGVLGGALKISSDVQRSEMAIREHLATTNADLKALEKRVDRIESFCDRTHKNGGAQ